MKLPEKTESKKRRSRRNDLLLIGFFLLIAAMTALFVKISQRPGKRVRVTVDGGLYGEYPLSEDAEIMIRTSKSAFYNKLVISDGKADMTKADCPDKICVHHSPVDKAGQTIVCLPHKVVVEVVDEEDEGGIDAVAE